MRVQIATGEHEGAVGQFLGYGSDVGIVVLDGATEAVEIPTGYLVQLDGDGGDDFDALVEQIASQDGGCASCLGSLAPGAVAIADGWAVHPECVTT